MKITTLEDAKELERQLDARGFRMVYQTLDENEETHPYKVSLLDNTYDEIFYIQGGKSPLDAIAYFARTKVVRNALKNEPDPSLLPEALMQ